MDYTPRKTYKKNYREFIELLYNEAKRRNAQHPFDVVFDMSIHYTFNRFTCIIDKKIVNKVDYALFSKWEKRPKFINMIKIVSYTGYIAYVENTEETTTFRLTENVLTIVDSEPHDKCVKNPEI